MSLRQVVNRTAQRGGKVVVPAFAVGRAQEAGLRSAPDDREKEIPNIPVVVDSPLAVNVTEVFKSHPECFDEETQAFMQNDRHKTVFGFDRLVYTRSVEDSKALNDRTDPMVIISASGMAETGRILHHLKNNVEDPKNTVMIVSWQSPETLGRRIADREARIKIFDDIYELRAEVATIGGLSAHAGQNLLLEYAQAVRSTVKGIYLVHGEPKPAEMLRGLLKERGIRQAHYPGLHESVDIG